jgi:signal peptidase II
LLVSAFFLIAIDQLVKAFVISRLGEGQAVSFGAVAFRRVTNNKVLASSLRSRAALGSLWAAEVVFFVAVAKLGPFFQGSTAAIAIGVALGGAGSNLLDRLFRDGVVDFIDFGFWPVFNVADVAIVVGALIGFINI